MIAAKYGLNAGDYARSVIAGQDDDRDAARLEVDLLGHVAVAAAARVAAVCICRREQVPILVGLPVRFRGVEHRVFEWV